MAFKCSTPYQALRQEKYKQINPQRQESKNWLSDLTGLETNEKNSICACGKWYTGSQDMK